MSAERHPGIFELWHGLGYGIKVSSIVSRKVCLSVLYRLDLSISFLPWVADFVDVYIIVIFSF